MKSYELRTSDGRVLLRGFAGKPRFGKPGHRETAVFQWPMKGHIAAASEWRVNQKLTAYDRPAPTDDQELVAELARIAATGKDLAFLGADLSDKERQLAGLTE